MRIAGIVRDSIVDGEGIRDVVFFQGCPHHCEGCHNSQTWDYNGGTVYTAAQIVEELSESSNDITISGGEPLTQWNALIRLLQLIRSTTTKRVWLYTGNRVTLNKGLYRYLAKYVDVIVDGKYMKDLRDTNLLFRGSSNQRIIDLPKSIKANRIVLWEGSDE